ncbi:MAG: sulfite exporter TauE/SafE family protein [Haloferacaceae archaeon]
MLTLTPAAVLAVGVVVAVGGFVTGLVGFGYAVVGTATLAALYTPDTAVVVMLLPILGANVSLLRELDPADVPDCVRRFGPYVAAALVGTLLGMVALTRIPRAPLTVVLGAFTLGYVLVSQRAVRIPGRAWVRDRCFVGTTRAKVGLGFVSGVVFGGSNVGVQMVAYLQSQGLDRKTFVGVMAMVFLGISLLRVGAAAWLDLYTAGRLPVSAVAVVPGLVGVELGRRARPLTPRRYRRGLALGVLTVVGVRLLRSGLGAV